MELKFNALLNSKLEGKLNLKHLLNLEYIELLNWKNAEIEFDENVEVKLKCKKGSNITTVNII